MDENKETLKEFYNSYQGVKNHYSTFCLKIKYGIPKEEAIKIGGRKTQKPKNLFDLLQNPVELEKYKNELCEKETISSETKITLKHLKYNPFFIDCNSEAKRKRNFLIKKFFENSTNQNNFKIKNYFTLEDIYFYFQYKIHDENKFNELGKILLISENKKGKFKGISEDEENENINFIN